MAKSTKNPSDETNLNGEGRAAAAPSSRRMIERLRWRVHHYQRELNEANGQLQSARDALASTQELHSSAQAELSSTHAAVAWTRTQLESTVVLLKEREAHLDRIYNSLGWRMLSRYGVLKNRGLLPVIGKVRGLFGKQDPGLLDGGGATNHKTLTEPVGGVLGPAHRKGQMTTGQQSETGTPAEQRAEPTSYEEWIRLSAVIRVDRATAQERTSGFDRKPAISIVMPVLDPPVEFLQGAIESVARQYYTNWELCIIDSGSANPEIQKVIESSARADPRIKAVYLSETGSMPVARDAAIELTAGEFVGFLDHDAELTSDALYEVVRTLQQTEADMVYSDEDQLDGAGCRCDPCFKPKWSPDLLLSFDYICHLAVYRKALLHAPVGPRRGSTFRQSHDLNLRFTEQTSRIAHIPRILYHQRKKLGCSADGLQPGPYANGEGLGALRSALSRRRIGGTVAPAAANGLYRVRRTIAGTPMVTIVILTRDRADLLEACVDSIEALTDYPCYEIIIVDNGSVAQETLAFLEQTRHRVIRDAGLFNYSRLNNLAAKSSRGEYLLLLNNDTEVISPDWLTAMVEQAQRSDVGAVGAKLIYPDYRIQHAGVVLGMPRLAFHARRFGNPDDLAYSHPANAIRNCAAVTGACLMIRRELYESMGGLNEDLRVAFNDVDLCLRLRENGYLVVFTPFALLYHHESASRSPGWDDSEVSYMVSRWESHFLSDPYYSPNLDWRTEECRPDFTKPESSACFCFQYDRDEPGLNLAEMTVGQYITAVYGNLCGIALSFAVGEGPEEGIVRLHLSYSRESESLRTVECRAPALRNGEFHGFFFKPVYSTKGQAFYFRVELVANDGDPERGGGHLRMAKYSKTPSGPWSRSGIGQLYINGVAAEGSLAMELFCVLDCR
ncbi:MAG TPA: glycosyltransferase family 2 protein [Blastocatellia bacterium]|nr:glycosyltransferase family 2 protein [Blastocatellia bacterium]